MIAIPILPILAGANLAFQAGRAIFGKRNKIRDPAQGERNSLVSNLLGDLEQTGGPVTDSAVFTAGKGALVDQVDDQAERDTARATGRGVAGTEFEIAQTAARNRGLASGLRGLTADAAGFQQRGRNALISQLLGALGQKTQSELSVQTGRQASRGQVASGLNQALQGAVLADFHATQGAA